MKDGDSGHVIFQKKKYLNEVSGTTLFLTENIIFKDGTIVYNMYELDV